MKFLWAFKGVVFDTECLWLNIFKKLESEVNVNV